MPQKILVVRFSSIGDIVLTTPVVRALHEQLGAEVHFLTKRRFAATLEANPYLTRLWTIERDLSEVLAELRAERFTAVVDLHVNLRTWHLRLGLGFPKTFAFAKLNWQKWLLTRWKIDRLPPVHIVDRYLAAAQPLGIKKDGKGLDYFIPAQAEVVLQQHNGQWTFVQYDQVIEWPCDRPVQAGYTALVIGAAHATKRLPEDRLVELAHRLTEPVLLLGGPDEATTGDRIAAQAGPYVLNLCGRLDLHGSASLVRQAARVITHDTGLMHIAAAFQQPIVSIWGNTVPAFGMYPYYGDRPDQNTTLEVTGLACRPCSKIGYAACPQGHFRCMREVDLSQLS